MKINMGAGGRRIPGYVGVDVVRREGTDILADARQVPLEDGCCDELIAIHLIEHFYFWEATEALAEWRRLLAPGGVLVLELPNLLKCCKNVVDGLMKGGKDPNQLGMWGLYGDPRFRDPFMNHKWGYTPKSLTDLLLANGFRDVTQSPPQWHPAGRDQRDMRLEAFRT